MRILRIATLLALSILAGCVTSEEQDAIDRGRDRDRCASFGYRPGSPAFRDCLFDLAEQRDRDRRAEQRSRDRRMEEIRREQQMRQEREWRRENRDRRRDGDFRDRDRDRRPGFDFGDDRDRNDRDRDGRDRDRGDRDGRDRDGRRDGDGQRGPSSGQSDGRGDRPDRGPDRPARNDGDGDRPPRGEQRPRDAEPDRPARQTEDGRARAQTRATAPADDTEEETLPPDQQPRLLRGSR